MNKKTITTIIIFIILIIFTSIKLIDKQGSPPKPLAEGGILDLRDYDLKEGALELNGQWEFIPHQLFDSEQFEKNKSYLVKVPSLWTKYEIEGSHVPKYANGTYRLKILLRDDDDILGIKTTNIRMSNEIYVNGKLVGKSGKPAERNSYIPHNNPYTVYFQSSEEIEILVRVANFDYASGGGIIGSIYFGDQEGIGDVSRSFSLYDWITITAFLTMFVYFLGTFLHFRKDTESLSFSLFCLSVVFYSITHGEKLLMSVIPNMSYEIFEKLQMLSSIVFGIFLLLYFYSALPKFTSKIYKDILLWIGFILCSTAALPAKINSELQMVYTLYLSIVLIYVIYVQIQAIRRKAVGAMYLILTSITIFIYFFVATLNIVSHFQLNLLPPMMPFIILTMLSLFISNRFTNSYLKKDELSKALIRIDKLKDQFLANTSHEFRTPLHGITAISQSILDKNDSKMSDQEVEKISLIMGIAQRLSHLVNDILDHSKLQMGELKLRIVPVDLYAITHVVVEIFNYMIDKNVTLTSYIPRGQIVLADEDRLRQILYNLIDNAVKYTEKGKVEITSYNVKDKVIIEVSDTGIGIPEENIEVLFKPFQQFENSVGGTGLGLSVTKELVEVLGGKISVQSTVGKGTKFFIELPTSDSVEKTDNYETKMELREKNTIKLSLPFRVMKGSKRILIADDDHINLKVLIDIIDTESYSIIAVDNGMAVLEELKKDPRIDLVLLDIMMPGLSGYEVSQQIRKSYNLMELPILMLTAAITPEDMIAAFQSGANDFLHKPFVASELKTRVRNLLLMKESSETVTKMEVAFLQAQIKPHFIYNVLNTILSLSYIDIEKSRTMITDFATFLRGSFAFENTSRLVPLDREISLIQSYVNIHQTRFPGQLEFEIEMEEGLNCLIPPLLLQPLVENAIIHGLRTKPEGGKVTLKIKQDGKLVNFQIVDNGNGIDEETLNKIWESDGVFEKGVGLLNIAKRLKHYENAEIKIDSSHRGTSVEIYFPLLSNLKKKF